MRVVAMTLCAGLFVHASCDRGVTRTPAATATKGLAETPVNLNLRQRSRETVPGSQGRLILAIDDVTRDRVRVTLHDNQNAVMPATEMRAGDTSDFDFDGAAYTLILKTLSNSLIGDDFAAFTIVERAGVTKPTPTTQSGPIDEHARIEALLADLASMGEVKFIRNGSEHDAAAAISHLRMKWEHADPPVTTASEFIDRIASTSSMSGEPYMIRRADGSTFEVGPYLRSRLDDFKNR